MSVEDPKKNAKRLVLLVWVMVAFFYFYISYDYIRIEMHNDQFGDYLRTVVQLAGSERRSPREIRSLLLAKADELRIPLTGQEIKIGGAGSPDLRVALEYNVEVDVPILPRGFYAKHFEHKAVYRQPR